MGEILRASSVSVGSCTGCGSIQLRLHDADGDIFATASFDAEIAADLIDQLVTTTEQVIAGLGGECVGHA